MPSESTILEVRADEELAVRLFYVARPNAGVGDFQREPEAARAFWFALAAEARRVLAPSPSGAEEGERVLLLRAKDAISYQQVPETKQPSATGAYELRWATLDPAPSAGARKPGGQA